MDLTKAHDHLKKIRCALEEPSVPRILLCVCHPSQDTSPRCLVKTAPFTDSNRYLLSFHRALQTILQEI